MAAVLYRKALQLRSKWSCCAGFIFDESTVRLRASQWRHSGGRSPCRSLLCCTRTTGSRPWCAFTQRYGEALGAIVCVSMSCQSLQERSLARSSDAVTMSLFRVAVRRSVLVNPSFPGTTTRPHLAASCSITRPPWVSHIQHRRSKLLTAPPDVPVTKRRSLSSRGKGLDNVSSPLACLRERQPAGGGPSCVGIMEGRKSRFRDVVSAISSFFQPQAASSA